MSKMQQKFIQLLAVSGFCMKTAEELAKVYDSSEKISRFRTQMSSLVLSKKSKKCTVASEYIKLCNGLIRPFPLEYLGWSIKPMQIAEEIQVLLSILKKGKILSMLEIGTANGGTLYLFTRMVDPNAKIISLDLPGGKFGGGYNKYRRSFYTKFARKNQRLSLIRADSHSPSSLLKIRSILNGQKLDFLFIDGDHSYEGVKQDYQLYNPLVKVGGIIALHDICKHPPEAHCEVSRFWNEIKLLHPHREIIRSRSQNWAGIGVLYK